MAQDDLTTEKDPDYIPSGYVETFKINGEMWGYDFAALTAEQVYGAVAWFEFHNQQIINPPTTARELKLSGGVEYMRGAFGFLLMRVESGSVQDGNIVFAPFDPAKSPGEAEQAFRDARGLFKVFEKIRKSFFLNTGMPKIESYRRYKDLIGSLAGTLLGSKPTPAGTPKPETKT